METRRVAQASLLLCMLAAVFWLYNPEPNCAEIAIAREDAELIARKGVANFLKKIDPSDFMLNNYSNNEVYGGWDFEFESSRLIIYILVDGCGYYENMGYREK